MWEQHIRHLHATTKVFVREFSFTKYEQNQEQLV
jgi:hypothetical protein